MNVLTEKVENVVQKADVEVPEELLEQVEIAAEKVEETAQKIEEMKEDKEELAETAVAVTEQLQVVAADLEEEQRRRIAGRLVEHRVPAGMAMPFVLNSVGPFLWRRPAASVVVTHPDANILGLFFRSAEPGYDQATSGFAEG